MALVIENGSIVAGADSFATAAELVTYAAGFGKTIPSDTTAQESLLRRAALQMQGMPWKGGLVSELQTLSWPRYDVYRYNWLVPSNTIPPQIKAGQMALACEIHADDIDPPELKKGAIIRERVEGAVETEFATAQAYVSRPAAARQSDSQFAQFLMPSNQSRIVRG
ncbi:DnaT-like ssDNA-binding protein [Metapseudomonas otitidis]|uniref:DnaT-like ssDNA-binding protein n=1 Tax=Metapseudomonas otitidis TaxID=319939 RepID=UPI00244AB95E|nr:DnaT-like ssDNA-binding protein [Pseudomonas otitidis]MDG9780270.1 hypothetical protein [Pseudomonas otitidis]